MSDYTTSKPVDLFGKQRSFRALSGVVINASQRSDTYVSGSGSTATVGGYGGGRTSIGSTVVVTSDLWIRGNSGQEHRLRFRQDTPVREGNVIHAVDVVNANVKVTQGFLDEKTGKFVSTTTIQDIPVSDGYVLLYNSTIQEWFYTGGLTNAVRNFHPWRLFWLIFGVSFLLCILLGNFTGNGIVALYTMIIGIFIAIMYPAWPGDYGLNRDNKKMGDTFSSTFSDELDEIAKQLAEPMPTRSDANNISSGDSPTQTHQKFCSSCGASLLANALFCGGCGGKLASVST